MIRYPRDESVSQQANDKGLPEPVLIRDIVRIVEVLNLKRKHFFSQDSVLAGSMALRCFGSPRFTVFDADFSTTTKVVYPETEMRKFLDYHDHQLDIKPAEMQPTGDDKSVWQSVPITYLPIFTSLVPNEEDREFKADVCFRGLVEPGLQRELILPYELDIWDGDAPEVYIMDPHEIMAEKILGWCADRHLKHYADLAFIAHASNPSSSSRMIEINYLKARDVLDAKLKTMRRIHPAKYARFPSIDALIGDLARDPIFSGQEWKKIMYLRTARDQFSQAFIRKSVQEIMVPRLRGAARR